jgi:hypothetical protein
MSRNPDLEALLQAQYDFEGAHPQERAAQRDNFHRRLDFYLERHNSQARKSGQPEITRIELIEALSGPYREFKKQRDAELMQRLRRLR